MGSFINAKQTGDVFIRNFDEGIYRSLGVVVHNNRPYVPLSKVDNVPPPLFDETHDVASEIGKPMPGIPIIISNPGDAVQRYNVPCFRITREDPSPALSRWMSLHLKYRRPADGEDPITITVNGRTVTGYAKYEEQNGSWPFDIPYTVTCEASGNSARTNAQILLKHLMKAFPPYAVVRVLDSIGESRNYNTFVEGPSELSQVADLRDRVIIHAMSLRLSGSLDLSDPRIVQAVTGQAVVTAHQLEDYSE